MLTALEDSTNPIVKFLQQPKVLDIKHLELRYEPALGLLWKFIRADSTPYFSHEQLDDIRCIQSAVEAGLTLDIDGYEPCEVKYLVFGSRLPNIFSLGGDLKLFRDLIEGRDRKGLEEYSNKATDAIVKHAANEKNVITFSLVQGNAMGGGFEAAIAGNVLVAEKGTRLGFPEVLFGLFPGMGAYTLLRRRVDALSAEKIILSGKNYRAEELYELGIVDILAEKDSGPDEIYAYISRHASRPGTAAFRRALNRAHAIDFMELRTIADEWVDAALRLQPNLLKRIDRLVSNQSKSYQQLYKTSNATLRIV